MLGAVFATNRNGLDAALLVLRLGLAVVMFPHGAQKVLGWFGGHGFGRAMQALTGNQHVPAALAVIVILTEFFGPLLLVVGFFTRVAALGIGADMLVAMLKVHLANGFFMNFSGHQKGEGIEYFIYAVVIAAAITICGAGAYSIDARLGPRGMRRLRR
jgi:putative oxidoreductase